MYCLQSLSWLDISVQLGIMQPRHIPISLLFLSFKEFICQILILENPPDIYSVVIFHYLLSITRKILSGSQSSHPVYEILFLKVSEVDALILFHTEKGTN